MALPVTSGLAIDLSAKYFTGTLNDRDSITTWPDISGNANNAVVTAVNLYNPQFRTARTPNGGDAIRLQGARLTFTSQNIFASSTSAEMHAVISYNDIGTAAAGFYQFGGNNGTNYPYTDGLIYDGSFTNSRFSYSAVTPANYHIYSVYHDGSNRVAMIDGTVIHTATVAFADPHTTTFLPTLLLGDLGGGANSWVGDCAEFVVYTRSLSSTERSSVLRYLRQQHMITTAPVSSNPVSSGLAIDLSAKYFTGRVGDGGTFTTWPDQSGMANDAVQSSVGYGGSSATMKAAQTPNGGPAILLAGPTLTFADQSVYSAATSGEVFAVLRSVGTAQGFYQFGGNDFTYFPYVDATVYDGSFTGTRYSFPAVDSGNYHVYNVSHDGTTRVTRIDGTVVHSATVAFTKPSSAPSGYNQLLLGNLTPGQSNWQGYVAEFVAYNRSLTSTERSAVLAYLTQQHIAASTALASISAPPVAAKLTVRGVVTSPGPASISAPALSLKLAVRGTPSIYGDQAVSAPPVALRAALHAGLVSATITLSVPADGAVVEVPRPQFSVALDAHDQSAVYTIQIQYADNSSFTGATTLSGTATAIDGGIYLSPTSDVSADTYWRARLLNADDTVELDWSSPLHFTLDTELTPSTMAVTWTVGSAARPIHLWALNLAAAAPGDTVTAYGQGFPSSGHVLLAGTPCTVTRWDLEPAVIDSISSARQITTDQVDPEHWEVEFTVPDIEPPGGVLEVTA